MENPATWNDAEKTIDRVLDQHYRNLHSDDPYVGWSLPKQIAEALRAEGLLNEK